MTTSKRRSPVENRARLLEIAGSQAGFFTAQQALEAGYARLNFIQHQPTGEWEPVLRGLYRLAAWPYDRTEHLVLWSLWSGGEGVVSYESCALPPLATALLNANGDCSRSRTMGGYLESPFGRQSGGVFRAA